MMTGHEKTPTFHIVKYFFIPKNGGEFVTYTRSSKVFVTIGVLC